jgi:hypothetical protein
MPIAVGQLLSVEIAQLSPHKKTLSPPSSIHRERGLRDDIVRRHVRLCVDLLRAHWLCDGRKLRPGSPVVWDKGAYAYGKKHTSGHVTLDGLANTTMCDEVASNYGPAA